ncbi:MAG: omega-6 fatty acid desaturase (delta-12 desaturase), partial [Francisellaceae bacterium]
LALDLFIFAAGMLIIFYSPYIIIKLIGGLLAGVATAAMFVWAHDAAHGALFKNSKTAEILGTIIMLPSLNIYRMWSFGHNKLHHGFTSFSIIDMVWRPLTPKEYSSLSKLKKISYRAERNFFSCAYHYLFKIWWLEMVKMNPGKDKTQRQFYRNGKLVILAYFLIASTLAYLFFGGIIVIVSGVIVPFIVFNYFIAMIVYLHHTHPDIPFFDKKQGWSHSVGALYCSTVVQGSKLSKILLHNIMTHVPHHLDPRIPFYHLPQAYQALQKAHGQYFHEYNFKWGYVRNIFKQCKLYDFENKNWMTFREARESELQRDLHL